MNQKDQPTTNLAASTLLLRDDPAPNLVLTRVLVRLLVAVIDPAATQGQGDEPDRGLVTAPEEEATPRLDTGHGTTTMHRIVLSRLFVVLGAEVTTQQMRRGVGMDTTAVEETNDEGTTAETGKAQRKVGWLVVVSTITRIT